MSCLQWVMQLVTGGSEEGLGEMAAQAEQDVDSLIAMYAQVHSYPFYQHQLISSAACIGVCIMWHPYLHAM